MDDLDGSPRFFLAPTRALREVVFAVEPAAQRLVRADKVRACGRHRRRGVLCPAKLRVVFGAAVLHVKVEAPRLCQRHRSLEAHLLVCPRGFRSRSLEGIALLVLRVLKPNRKWCCGKR